jgi:hypothetical protein
MIDPERHRPFLGVEILNNADGASGHHHRNRLQHGMRKTSQKGSERQVEAQKKKNQRYCKGWQKK